MNKETFDILWKLTVLIVLILMMILTYHHFQKGTIECLYNPFIYGAKEISEKYNGSVYCSCDVLNIPVRHFTFTEEKFNPNIEKDPRYEIIIPE